MNTGSELIIYERRNEVPDPCGIKILIKCKLVKWGTGMHTLPPIAECIPESNSPLLI